MAERSEALASEAHEACRALCGRPAGVQGRSPGGGWGAKPPGKFLKNKGILEALRAILSIETSTKLMSNFHEKYDITIILLYLYEIIVAPWKFFENFGHQKPNLKAKATK